MCNGAALFLANAAQADAQILRVAEGQLSGARSHGVISFLGVPYAEPPHGEQRWRAPRPMPAWNGAPAFARTPAAAWTA